MRLSVVAVCAAIALPASAAVIRYPGDVEPMVMVGEPGPYTAVVMYDPPAIEFVRRPARISFARLGDEQCMDKLAGPVPCEADDAAPPDEPDHIQAMVALFVTRTPVPSKTPAPTPVPTPVPTPMWPLPPVPPVIVDCNCKTPTPPTPQTPETPAPTPVPLPASGWLLALAVALLWRKT